MKTCNKCGGCFDLSSFYKHPKMADGYLSKCKECTKSDVKMNRDKKADYYRQYDSWRFRNDPKVKQRILIYHQTDAAKESINRSTSAWRAANPEKRSAHSIMSNAVRSGRLIKPECCSRCGEFKPSRQIQAHHHDYTKPLDVTWLCSACHSKEHGFCKLDPSFSPKRKTP